MDLHSQGIEDLKQLKLKFKGESLEALDKTYKDVKLDKDVTLMLEVVTKSGAPAPASANGAKGGTGAARGAAGPPAARLAEAALPQAAFPWRRA